MGYYYYFPIWKRVPDKKERKQRELQFRKLNRKKGRK